MALVYSSDKITNKKYIPSATPHSAREEYVVTSKVTVGDPLVDNDLVGLSILPPNCIPTDIKILCDELSDGTDIVFDVGVLNTATTDLVASSLLMEGITVCQNTGGIAYMNKDECVWTPATWLAESACPDLNVEKTIALKVTTPATTEKVGDLHVRFCYRAAENGV